MAMLRDVVLWWLCWQILSLSNSMQPTRDSHCINLSSYYNCNMFILNVCKWWMWLVKTEGFTSFLNCEHILINFWIFPQHSDFYEVVYIPTLKHSTYKCKALGIPIRFRDVRKLSLWSSVQMTWTQYYQFLWICT